MEMEMIDDRVSDIAEVAQGIYAVLHGKPLMVGVHAMLGLVAYAAYEMDIPRDDFIKAIAEILAHHVDAFGENTDRSIN